MTTLANDCELYYSTLADDADLAEIVELFVMELPERLLKLNRAADRADWMLVANLAHQIRGAGGSHGFAQLTPYAARLERTAREGEPEGAIRVALANLIDACGRVRAGQPE
ncbi:MAG: Hpt domain-containing protein [Pirellulaceae bacterium]|nr:Hpt domain-containing protein [Pirellulaceae bacterium]